MSDQAGGVADDRTSRTRVLHGSEPKQVHQFQKNSLLPYLEGSSLPSMVGLGSGRGLDW